MHILSQIGILWKMLFWIELKNLQKKNLLSCCFKRLFFTWNQIKIKLNFSYNIGDENGKFMSEQK